MPQTSAALQQRQFELERIRRERSALESELAELRAREQERQIAKQAVRGRAGPTAAPTRPSPIQSSAMSIAVGEPRPDGVLVSSTTSVSVPSSSKNIPWVALIVAGGAGFLVIRALRSARK